MAIDIENPGASESALKDAITNLVNAPGDKGQVVISGDDGFTASGVFTFIADGEYGDQLNMGDAKIASYNDVVTITTAAQGQADTQGLEIKITGGDANGDGKGGNVTITSGLGGGEEPRGGLVSILGSDNAHYGGTVDILGGAGHAYYGGYVSIVAGPSNYGTGGELTLKGGGTSSGQGGAVNLRGGGATYGNGGHVLIQGGISTAGGVGGDLTLSPGPGAPNGKLKITNANVANGTVACVLTASSGPAGAQTDVQGWLKVNIGGTNRFIPFW